MYRKKIYFKYKKERCILSDVLPYEVPITFSNRHYYHFLVSNNIEYSNGKIKWKSDGGALDEIIKILYGVTTQQEKPKFISIPFGYKISHKKNQFRELTICHPKNQLKIIDFYDRHKELILYYCNVSSFSIRRPKKVSKFRFHKDNLHYDILSEDTTSVKKTNKEYENLRSFFVYKEYNNIYKFYESDLYHRCEKKYNKLLKLDISKCFDSIYTHTLAWAQFSKENIKENLTPSKKTFAGCFDELMMELNYMETSGIIIGSEFSRIFAELILQSIDKDVELTLKNKHKLLHKKDYEAFRYVDDYFIFYNDESVKDSLLETLQLNLKEYKLYLNSNKAVTYDKPIITEMSMAKERIAKLLNEKLQYKLEKIEVNEVCNNNENQHLIKGSIYINKRQLIIQFKTIIKEYDVEYKDMLNYSFFIVEKKSKAIIKNHKKVSEEHRTEKHLTHAILALIEFIFFIYSVSPKVNTTIRLCRILSIFNSYYSEQISSKDYKNFVFKNIYDNIIFLLKKNKNAEHTQVETLYLLIALSELGKNYWLEEKMLSGYFNIRKDEDGSYSKKYTLNYFSITVLLFYMKNKKRYHYFREFIEQQIIKMFDLKKENLRKDTEKTLLLFDTISCPYVSPETKEKLLGFYDIKGLALKSEVIKKIKKQRYWFTKWDDFNFKKELDAKHSTEVY